MSDELDEAILERRRAVLETTLGDAVQYLHDHQRIRNKALFYSSLGIVWTVLLLVIETSLWWTAIVGSLTTVNLGLVVVNEAAIHRLQKRIEVLVEQLAAERSTPAGP